LNSNTITTYKQNNVDKKLKCSSKILIKIEHQQSCIQKCNKGRKEISTSPVLIERNTLGIGFQLTPIKVFQIEKFHQFNKE